MSKTLKAVKKILPIYKQSFDGWAEQAYKEHPVSCRRGCHDCCYNLTKATLAEGAAVAAHLLEKGTFGKYRPQLELTARLADSVLDAKNGDGDDGTFRYLAAKQPCAFLENGECSIYDLRPASCRSYLVVSPPANCSPDRPGAETHVIDARFPMARFVQAVIQSTHPAVPAFIGPFPSVVLAGKELIERGPGSFKRWASKSPLFDKNDLDTPV